LLDQVTDPIILYDKNLRIQFANAAFLTLTDRTLEELVGKRDKEAWPPQIYSQYINELEETFKTGSIRVVELKQSFKLEDTRDLVLVMHPVIDVDGRVVEAFITFDDRTDLVLAEGEKIRLEVERATLEKTLYKALLDTINAISLTVEKRDPYTAGHQNRVAQLSVAIAERLGWDAHRIEGLRLGAMIHDMGKIYVPSEILNRPGKLTNDEFNLIKAHPRVGEEIISAISFPWPVAEMVCQHHERIDGSGYPYGLKGDRIVEEAKIIAVADVVEAITSHRPYRAALGLEEGLAEIEGGRGTKYAAEYVDACVALIRNEGFTFS
jgi:HD-GYP domain-containing protein (c-di-GMP phosphodiesterase class II)